MAENKTIKPSIGGQALIEGVMMKGVGKYAVAVRKPNREIDVTVTPTKSRKISKIPFIRGIVTFVDSLIVGYAALMKSAEISMSEDELEESKSKFDLWLEKKLGDKANNVIMFFAAVFGLGLALLLFTILPTVIVTFIDKFIALGFFKTIIEGVLKIGLFMLYLYLISKSKDVYRTFCYHGAEHKTIACYEANEKLTVENVRKQTRFHPRCGTSFILIVLVISILLFSAIPWTNPLLRIVYKIVLLPIVMGLSYEVIRLAGTYNNPVTRAISAPGLFMQRFTTNEPADEMIEVAIASVFAVLPEEDVIKFSPEVKEEPKIEQEAKIEE